MPRPLMRRGRAISAFVLLATVSMSGPVAQAKSKNSKRAHRGGPLPTLLLFDPDHLDVSPDLVVKAPAPEGVSGASLLLARFEAAGGGALKPGSAEATRVVVDEQPLIMDRGHVASPGSPLPTASPVLKTSDKAAQADDDSGTEDGPNKDDGPDEAAGKDVE